MAPPPAGCAAPAQRGPHHSCPPAALRAWHRGNSRRLLKREVMAALVLKAPVLSARRVQQAPVASRRALIVRASAAAVPEPDFVCPALQAVRAPPSPPGGAVRVECGRFSRSAAAAASLSGDGGGRKGSRTGPLAAAWPACSCCPAPSPRTSSCPTPAGCVREDFLRAPRPPGGQRLPRLPPPQGHGSCEHG